MLHGSLDEFDLIIHFYSHRRGSELAITSESFCG